MALGLDCSKTSRMAAFVGDANGIASAAGDDSVKRSIVGSFNRWTDAKFGLR
jgi:hypothetical protein